MEWDNYPKQYFMDKSQNKQIGNFLNYKLLVSFCQVSPKEGGLCFTLKNTE
jgi:hypothetical protein